MTNVDLKKKQFNKSLVRPKKRQLLNQLETQS